MRQKHDHFITLQRPDQREHPLAQGRFLWHHLGASIEPIQSAHFKVVLKGAKSQR